MVRYDSNIYCITTLPADQKDTFVFVRICQPMASQASCILFFCTLRSTIDSCGFCSLALVVALPFFY